MSHRTEIRERVIEYLESGGLIKSAVEIFKVSRSSIQRWRRRKAQTGEIKPTERKNLPYKIDDEALKLYIAKYPDAYLTEIAEVFSVTDSGVYRALKRLGITRKKSRHSTPNEMKKSVANT